MKNLMLLYGFMLLSLIFAGPTDEAQAARGSVTVNVRDYGAKGDGKTNDTSAIKTAIAAIGANTGSTVLFPAGDYLYDDTLVAEGITLRGQRGAILRSDSAQAYVRLTGRNGGVIGLKFDKASISFPMNPLIMQFAVNFTVSDNEFNLGIITLLREWDIIVENSSYRGTIANNTLRAPGGMKLSQCKDITISGNNITGREFGVFLEDCARITIDKNTLQASTTLITGEAIYMSNEEGGVVSGNTINTFGYGMVLKQCRGCRLTGNQLDCTTDGAKSAIDTFGGSNLTINNNKVLRSNGDGIRCIDCVSSLVISQNELMNCALGAIVIPKSVIYVEPRDGYRLSLNIVNNSYAGRTTGLNYFIECLLASPPAVVQGNRTNTMLPNKIGP